MSVGVGGISGEGRGQSHPHWCWQLAAELQLWDLGLSSYPALGHRTQGPGLPCEEQDETHLLISCWLIRLLYPG